MQWPEFTQGIAEILFKIFVFFQGLFQIVGFIPAPCEEPLAYTLGEIDSRFEISQEEILSAVDEAVSLWETASGRDLFVYDKSGGLPVSFVYDERQERTQAGQTLEEKLANLQVDESQSELRAEIAGYERTKNSYEQEVKEYETALEKYNQRVSSANKKGGATESEYDALQREEENLRDRYRTLEKRRQELNTLANKTNASITTNQVLVDQYNQEVNTFQDVYGGEGEVFDQGVYTGKDITIYQYEDRARLVLVLAHEMGHALGIEHVENPEALMYYLMKDQEVGSTTLTEVDKQALERVCQKPTLF